MLSVSEAQALILAEARSFGTEKIALAKSFGRVLAEDALADRDYPPFNRSTMDGYAIVAEKFAAQKEYPVQRTVFAGDTPLLAHHLSRGQAEAIKIMTGAAVPKPFNAVIRREDASEADGLVKFAAGVVSAGHNISLQGEDLTRGEKILLRGKLIDSATVSLLASLGQVRPQVARLPQVAIISTGNEIIPPGKKPNPVQIRNANAFALQCQLAQCGISRVKHIHVADEKKQLGAAIKKFSRVDVLLMTGGVSAGDSDYVPEVLEKLKFKKIFHKVQMKPGKPLWFGRRGKTVVFAVPGNPYSAQVIFRIFIEPYLRFCSGIHSAPPLALPLAESRRKKDSLENLFPVKIKTNTNSLPALAQLPFNGSGDVRAALFSDGIAAHPAGQAELAAGSIVDFYPWRSI
ncbi:MAG: molybdopterin molybdotransferase MoeA [Turneriella sp.]